MSSESEVPPGRTLRSRQRRTISKSHSQAPTNFNPPSDIQQPPPPPTTILPTNARPKKRRASEDTHVASSNSLPDKLSAVGLTIGSKTSRNRLLELLDQYVKPKRARLSDSALPKRILSAQEARPKPKPTSDPELFNTQAARFQTTLQDVDFNSFSTPDLIKMVEGVGLDGEKMSREDLVRACKQYRELIILPSEGFAFTLTSKPPRKPAVAQTRAPHPSGTRDLEADTMSPRNRKGKGRDDSPVPSVSLEPRGQEVLVEPPPKSALTKTQATRPSGTPDLEADTISLRNRKGKGKAVSPGPLTSEPSDQAVLSDSLISQAVPSHQQQHHWMHLAEPSHAPQAGPSRELAKTSGSAELSSLPDKKTARRQRKLQDKEQISIQDKNPTPTLPSLQHSRFLYPRPPPTTLSPPAPRERQKEHLSQSDEEWSPENEATRDLSDSSDGSKSPEDSDCLSQPPPGAEITRKRKASSKPSRPPDLERLPTSPVPSVRDYKDTGATDEDSCEEPENESGRLKKTVFQLKHTLSQTNQRLDKVEKRLKVLTDVLSTSTDVGQSPLPSKRTRGGRSSSWMRMHIDTLLGRRPDEVRLPPPATDAQKASWKAELNIDILNPDTTISEPTPTVLDPSFPYPHGPGHLEATPQQLSVMSSMMRAAGVSTFRPDFSAPSSSKDNKFLWALAFRIFIKLVECGEYSGVSIDAENIPHLKRSMKTRIRSLTKQYQQETWVSERKKRAASNARSCARLRYLKKNRERIVLANPSLWLLSPIIRSASSDDGTEHEDCLHPSADEHKSPCHIRKLTWRSEQLERIFTLLDTYRVRLDHSIPKPSKPSQKQNSSQDSQNTTNTSNGRPPRTRLRCPNASSTSLPPPQGLPVDCYSSEWLETLTAAERSELEMAPALILPSLLSTVESL